MQESTLPADHPHQRPRRYLRQDLRDDAMAGLTVAVMGVPQAMAYALIAGLQPVYGLYTAIVTCTVAAVLGSSRHLVTGPTNALCMVMFSLTNHLTDKPDRLLEIILLVSFMAGVIQLGFGLLRLGGIVRYVSNSVVIGFTAGAGILIALNQAKNILGVEIADAQLSHEVFIETARQAVNTNWYALTIGVVTALFVILLPKIHRRIPGALIGVAATGTASYFLGWHTGVMDVEIVGDIQEVKGSLDIFHVPELLAAPDFELTRELAPGALAVAILGLIEATSISRAIARSSGQRLDFTKEFIGQGASKMVGGFFTCFAGSGSFTRTALCFKSGGRTRMAAIFSAFWTLLTLLLLGDVANFIPTAALAGLLIVTAYSMVDKARLRLSWRSGRNSQLVLAGTLGSTLVLPLEWAIFVGVFLSLVVILRTTGHTDLSQLVPRQGGGFDELPFNRAAPSPIVTVNMSGDVYFAAAEELDAELLQCIRPDTRVMVLRMKRLRAVGSTAMAMLAHLWSVLRSRNIHLVVCGIEKELEDVMTSTGVRAKIGEANIFYADIKVFQATELALARARTLVNWGKPAESTSPREPDATRRRLTAKDLMATRCIRFGNQHQVREAVWLMTELHKHTKAIGPEPLFLQDREGKLYGELSPWRILESLAAGADDDAADLPDERIAVLLRRDFTSPIRKIARTDVVRQTADTSLARLLETSVENDQRIIPICDDDGRLKGLVSAEGLLRGLAQALAADQGQGEDEDG